MDRDDRAVLLALALTAIVLTGGFVAKRIALSHRNNNPGNVEKGTAWKGIDPVATQKSPRFAVFLHPKWGFRAMARIFKGDYLEGQNTVRSLITEWSPPIDVYGGKSKVQDTAAYIRAISTALFPGENPLLAQDTPFNVIARMPDLLAAVARHETGYMPNNWTRAVIAEGIFLERAA